jgi:hypothetical protein
MRFDNSLFTTLLSKRHHSFPVHRTRAQGKGESFGGDRREVSFLPTNLSEHSSGWLGPGTQSNEN